MPARYPQKKCHPRVSVGCLLALLCLVLPQVAVAQGEEGTLSAPSALPPGGLARQRVVLLMFEGFAPSLLSATETPHFDRLRDEGAWTHRLHGVFPTQSWTNGASLETGCWPERHGIVADRFIDPERGRFDREPLRGWLAACEDLGMVARRQGVSLRRFGGYGIDAESEPERCDGGARRRDVARQRELLEHLRRPGAATEREIVLARFCTPARVIRGAGVDTPRSAAAVAEIDTFVGEVMAALEGREGASALIVATDHGMRDVSHLIQFDRILERHDIEARVESGGSTALLYLPPGSDPEEIAGRLREYDFFDVLQKGALPAYAHWGEGPRVPDLVISAYPPYFIEARERWPYWLRPLSWIAPDHLWAEGWRRATSGYVPRTPAMYGLVYAWGAGVEGGREAQALRVIDLHPTLTTMMGITPGSPLDGRPATSLLQAAPAPDEAAALGSLP